MKKKFQNLEISIVYFMQDDFITTSGDGKDIEGESYFENELPVFLF